MKRRMKLLLADLFIGALTLVYGCPLWWTGMIEVWKTAILRSPLLARCIKHENSNITALNCNPKIQACSLVPGEK